MRLLSLAAALSIGGCQTYAVPPLLHSPPPPVVALPAEGGSVRAGGTLGVNGAEGSVVASSPGGLGAYVRASRLAREGTAAETAAQRDVEAGVLLTRPVGGPFRTEIGAGAAWGEVGGMGLDAAEIDCGTIEGCVGEREPYRAEGALRREHVQLTLATGGGRRGAVGVTGRLSRVSVTDVASSRGGSLPDARSTFVGLGVFARASVGPVGLDVSVGAERPVSGAVVPDDGGPERALGGRYRAAPGYASVGLSLDLAALGGGR